jgi:hypothetical protein
MLTRRLEIAHYKWTDRIIERVRSDYRVTSEAGIPCSIEYTTVPDHCERHGASPGRSSTERTDRAGVGAWSRLTAKGFRRLKAHKQLPVLRKGLLERWAMLASNNRLAQAEEPA